MTLSDIRAVTFDFGQTLAELDTAMLSRRLAERGFSVPPAALDAALEGAWQAYNGAIRAGHGGHPWHLLMATLLRGAGVDGAACEGLAAWLFALQPESNLWRRPIAGMIELVDALRAAGLKVGVISNSEGGLAGLIEEMGWQGRFDAVADSGVLKIEKPDRAIFAWMAEALGVPLAATVHVGDAYSADYVGALGAGARAVLFRGDAFVPEGVVVGQDPHTARCREADALAAILEGWGVSLAATLAQKSTH